MRPKTCPVCKTKFTPAKPLQAVCDWPCAIQHAAKLKAKRERKETKEAKARLKTRQDWMREAQAAFNRWIRHRDAGQPCISCGRHHQGQYHAGHYRGTKAAPELRFHEQNVHKQCSVCNNHLSGNIVEYRKALVQKIGVLAVEQLEGPHEPKKYTVEELKAIKAEYTNRLKQIKLDLDDYDRVTQDDRL